MWLGGEEGELITIYDAIQQLCIFHNPFLLSPSFLPPKKKTLLNVDTTKHMENNPIQAMKDFTIVFDVLWKVLR